MELRLNLALLVVLGLAWTGMRATTPTRLMADSDMDLTALADLEDTFARDPHNAVALGRLADAYLAAEQPGLAVVVMRSAPGRLMDQPHLAHRLARAYEDSGRLLDALATADLALARCGRVVGSTHNITPAPTYDCSERTFATLDMHKSALERMVRWGIVDPSSDPRARRAYQLSLRRARIAIHGDDPDITVR